MKKRLLPITVLAAGMVLTLSLYSQTRHDTQPPTESEPVHLPNGKLQSDEILKEDHEKSIKDAAQLIDLAESLKQDLEKDDAHILSIADLKKTEEIEKIAKRIRTRLKRF